MIQIELGLLQFTLFKEFRGGFKLPRMGIWRGKGTAALGPASPTSGH